MKRTIAAAALALTLTGCNVMDNNSKWFPWTTPDEGRVNGKTYTPESWHWVAPTTSCSGTPSVCTTTPGYMQHYPEHWDLDIYADNGSGDHGWVQVDQWEFDRCEEDDRYPDCTEGD